MKLTAQIKLLPTPEQADLLLRTMEMANRACNAISAYAWQHGAFRQYDLHHALYHDLRQQFPLSAQMVVRCLGKVADSYKLDRATQRTFMERGGIAYDSRLLTYKEGEVSTISKRLVEKAKDTGRAIALEDLSGIRSATVSRAERSRHHNWAFYDLRSKITYKARRRGVPVVLVDPAYTSRTCHACGHCEKANRKRQAAFVCQACGHCDNADRNAALNIAARAEVNQPIVAQAA